MKTVTGIEWLDIFVNKMGDDGLQEMEQALLLGKTCKLVIDINEAIVDNDMVKVSKALGSFRITGRAKIED